MSRKPDPEQDAWEREHPGKADPEFYRREVHPVVQGMSLKAIQKATGLSLPSCGRIRGGEQVPHRRWWSVLGAPDSSAIRRPPTKCRDSDGRGFRS